MHRLGLPSLIMLMLPISPVSAVVLRRAAALQLNASKQTKALVTPALSGDGKHAPNGMHLHVNLEGYSEDAQARKLDQAHNPSGNVLPPECPADVSETSAYMTELVKPDPTHTICEKDGETYREPCDRKGSNLERLNSIRGLLKTTAKLLNDKEIPYALHGGSAIGQMRCEDVLPWDADCDVIIWQSDMKKISEGDLDSQYRVVHTTGNSAIPYVVLDKNTGFYCDIFYMQYQPRTGEVGMAWPWGKTTCPGMDYEFPFTNEPKRCDMFPAYVVGEPFKPCVLDGNDYTCFRDQEAMLKIQYGPYVVTPDVTTQPAQRSKKDADQEERRTSPLGRFQKEDKPRAAKKRENEVHVSGQKKKRRREKDHLKMLQINGDGKMMKASALPGKCDQPYWISEQTGTIYHVSDVADCPFGKCSKAIALQPCATCSPNQLVETIERSSSLVFDQRIWKRLDKKIPRLGDLVSGMSVPCGIAGTSNLWCVDPLLARTMSGPNSPYSVDIKDTDGVLTAEGYFIPDVSDVSTSGPASRMKKVLEEDAYWDAQKLRRDTFFATDGRQTREQLEAGKVATEMREEGIQFFADTAKRQRDKHEAFGYEAASEVHCGGSNFETAMLQFIFPHRGMNPFGKKRMEYWRGCADESCSGSGAFPEIPKILRKWREMSKKDIYGNGVSMSTEQLLASLQTPNSGVDPDVARTLGISA